MCNIQITSVQGVSTLLYAVSITGTASDCVEVVVSINCGQEQKKQVPVINGAWQADFIYGDICPCGSGGEIIAHCVNNPACVALFEAPIPCGCCPSIIVSPKFGPCINGQRVVQLVTNLFISEGCTPVSVSWEYGNGNFGSVHTFALTCSRNN